MKRLLVPFIAVLAALAAACGSGTQAGSDDPAALLRQSADAMKDARAAAFSLSAAVEVDGAAGAQGAYTVKVSGRAGRFDDAGRFDVRFEVGMRGMSVAGRAKSADGRTAYVQLPLLLGPGWKSIDMTQVKDRLEAQGARPDAASREHERLAREALEMVHPDRWVRDVEVTHPGGDDRIEGSLDVRGMVEDLLAVGLAMAQKEGNLVPGKELDRIQREVEKALPKVERALRRADGSITLDADTHLPTELRADVAVDLPAEARSPGAPSAVSLAVSLSFSDWNEEFSVEAPADAEPLDLSRLGALGGGWTAYAS
jgi:hypothetical protein